VAGDHRHGEVTQPPAESAGEVRGCHTVTHAFCSCNLTGVRTSPQMHAECVNTISMTSKGVQHVRPWTHNYRAYSMQATSL
jgi:hypothetical protein